MIVSLAVTLASSFSLNAKRGLPLPNQGIAWLLLFTSFLTPSYIVHRIANPTQRIIALIFAFIPVYTILTTSYELLFLCFFSLLLLLWLLLERRLDNHRRATSPAKSKTTTTAVRRLTLEDVRRAVFLLFFIHVGFFATGNIASVSSFYLQPVYRLVGQFMPFLMAALLLYKIFIPFLVVAAVVHGLNRELGLPPFGIFLVALSISDVLSLSFFCLVTDQGSWLEIGQSISHFAISNMLLLFMALLFVWGELLMR
jgi:phosphatidylinositol glycan class N